MSFPAVPTARTMFAITILSSIVKAEDVTTTDEINSKFVEFQIRIVDTATKESNEVQNNTRDLSKTWNPTVFKRGKKLACTDAWS